MEKAKEVVIEIDKLYLGTAKLANLDEYVSKALDLSGKGNIITLTGPGPVWLYLKVAHALHGRACKLIYNSPVTGDVVIFDHSPW